MRFCVAPGYRCVRGAVAALAHFSLSNRNLLDHKSKMRSVCVLVLVGIPCCQDTMCRWMATKACVCMSRSWQWQELWSVCVDWWVMQSLWVCAWWAGHLEDLSSQKTCLGCIKNASACLLDWKLFTFREKLQHLVSWCSDSACYAMLLQRWDAAVEDGTQSPFFMELKNRVTMHLYCILKLLFPTDYLILDRVTGKDMRRHPAGLCLLQLCVWIKLKHSSLLFPSCPETSFTEHAALSFFNSFLNSSNSTFLCSPSHNTFSLSFSLAIYHSLHLILLLSGWQRAAGPLLLAASQSVT